MWSKAQILIRTVLIRARREQSGACARLGQHNYNQSHGFSQPFNENLLPGKNRISEVQIAEIKIYLTYFPSFIQLLSAGFN